VGKRLVGVDEKRAFLRLSGQSHAAPRG